ncbi:MAG: glycosyltransferase, partial [Gemmatimonadota bacterium]
MTVPRRVLHLVLDLHEGGLERVVVDLVQGTDRGRFETSVLCLARRGQLADELPPNQVHLAPAMTAGSMLIPLALTRTLEQLAPDLVHIHSGVWF